MVGWRLLNDALQGAWMLGFTIYTFYMFPRLFPRFSFDTPKT